jgi:peptidoglycan/xylan/chitin deacetylase (PgdA/CDA1 family)
MGAEGVVLKCGERVVKVFDLWSRETRTSKFPEIRALVGLDTAGALPDIIAVYNSGEFLAIEYHYEESEPYCGWHGPEVAQLLMRLGRSNLVHSNVSPKNLRMTARGLQLIDIGKSIEQATEHGREMMLRRAFLSWRFAYREDLVLMLRRSLREAPIPELTGYEALKEAVYEKAPKHRLDAELFEKLGSTGATRVLDYGCGKPRPPYIPAGMVAYDPDPGLREQWEQSTPGVAVWSRRDLDKALGKATKFDTILCSLVLCSVDDEEAACCLADMRRLVAGTGKLLVAVCDPGSVHVEQAIEQVRLNTGNIDPRSSCTYGKFIRSTGNTRIEHHRSLDTYRRMFAKSGFAVRHEEVVFGTDLDRFEKVPEFRIFELCPLPALRQRTALLIKLCAMEADSAEQQVRHLVAQLSFPRRFDEIALLIDPFKGPFPRQHTSGDILQLRAVARRLETEGVVDRVIDGLVDGERVEEAALKWTGIASRFAHSANGQPALSFLEAFTGLGAGYVLHADADVLIGRPDRQHDHILEAVEYMEANSDVVTLALPVFGNTTNSAEQADATGVPYRVEAICGWVAVDRLQRLKPLPAKVISGRLDLPWHRMVDTAIREGRGSSVRKGSRGIWFAAVDNTRKADDQTSALLMERVEAGYAPPLQQGRPLVAGTVRDWSGPGRAEEMVLVICGRNVRPGAVERCFASLRAQTFQGWGAVVVDDASDAPSLEAQKLAVAKFGSRITHVSRRQRAGLLANTYMAVRDFVVAPETVIVTLDMDDALASPDALQIVLERHRSGADLTVGSMLRTDKKVNYPANFNHPRANRGGNVWQHLRSFRKHLFDRIPVEALKPDGEWVDLANDWAYMLPMAELAQRPEQIEEVIYLHEPSTSPRPIVEVKERENVISKICALSKVTERPGTVPDCTILCYHRFLPDARPSGAESFYLKRGMAVRGSSLRKQLLDLNGIYNPVSIRDYVLALNGQRSLPERPLLVTVDDGYRDFRDIALPIFQNAGIEPVLFSRIPVEDGYPDWAPLDLFYCAIGRQRANADILDADWLAWRENLLRQPLDRQLQMVEAKTGCRREEMRSERERLYLSVADLNGFQGVTVCGHGTSHVRWTNLDKVSLRAVLSQCAGWLDGMKSPRIVAYPDGSCDTSVAAELLKSAFDAAFVIGASNSSMPARFGIGRIIVPDEPGFFSARADVATEVVA